MTGNYFLLGPILLPVVIGIFFMFVYKENTNPLTKSQKNTIMRVSLLTAIINILVLLFAMSKGGSLKLLQITEFLSVEFYIDSVGLIFILLVSVIWILAVMYAIEYMSHEIKIKRFFSFFIITLGAMLGIGMSANLFTFYMFYEFMTLMTYPLVINEMSDRAKSAGNMYLAYSLIGASLTLIALFVVTSLGVSADFVEGGALLSVLTDENRSMLLIIYFIAIIGYGAKAGLYPMHAWLPKAHPVAPAPASGVLSGLITKAGVLGVIRLTYYVFGSELIFNSWAHTTLLILTLITIFLGSMLAFKAKELKVRLAYSSISQVSYVLFGILLLNPTAFVGGILQILSHSMIKNLLFFAVGAIMHETGKTNVDQIRGEGKSMPIIMWTFTIGSLSLIGIPPLSGFVSKLYLAMGSLQLSSNLFGIFGIIVLILSSLLTAGYLLPIVIKAFFPGNDFDYQSLEKYPSKLFFNIPVVILSLGIVILGVYPEPIINYITSITQNIM